MPAPPPALTCKLPGPWHDSHPISVDSFEISPPAFAVLLVTTTFLVCSRACVAVRKSRTICSWQVAHSSEPTNSAPGMLGGATIVRLVVLQESKITARATAPPALHKKLSRLPCIHRVSLENHTNREYAQKLKIVTTHFFGFFLVAILILPTVTNHVLCGTELRWRFARKLPEHAIELRQRLKSRSERDLTDSHIAVT